MIIDGGRDSLNDYIKERESIIHVLKGKNSSTRFCDRRICRDAIFCVSFPAEQVVARNLIKKHGYEGLFESSKIPLVAKDYTLTFRKNIDKKGLRILKLIITETLSHSLHPPNPLQGGISCSWLFPLFLRGLGGCKVLLVIYFLFLSHLTKSMKSFKRLEGFKIFLTNLSNLSSRQWFDFL